jgi:hypothetical protein
MVDRRLRPDLNALEAQLCSGHFQLVFLIHYFGVPQVDVEKFVEMCHRYNVKVIEDCAHTLMGGLEGRRLGSFGDFAIFSVHKSTAAVDGGFFYDHQGVFDEFELTEPLLISAETLTEFVNTDIEAVSRHRLRNYQTVQRWVRSIPQLKFYSGAFAKNERCALRNLLREILLYSCWVICFVLAVTAEKLIGYKRIICINIYIL